MLPRNDCVTVPIAPAEALFLREKAIARVGLKRHNFRQSSSRSDAELNYLGMRGEYAASRYLVVPFRWELAAVQGHRGRTNLEFRGLRVDVKFTEKRAPPLYLYYGTPEEGIEAFTADVAILAIPGAGDDVVLVGWITRDRYRQLARPERLPGRAGVRYIVKHSQLEPMAALLGYHAAPEHRQEALF